MLWMSRKTILRLLQAVFIATFIFWYTANLWVERKLPFIEATIGQALGCPVTIENAHYNLFRGFSMAGVEIKQYKPQLLTFRVERVWAHPEFSIYPEPAIWIRSLTLDRPETRLQTKPEALFKLGSVLQEIPVYKNKIGLLTVGLRLKSFRINKGRLSLVSPQAGDDWSQDFESVKFFWGDKWFKKNTLDLGGHILGKPQANFRIRLDAKGSSRGSGMDSDLRLDFHEFTTAYISPYLRDLFRLPERNLTASARFNIQEGNKIQIRGKILMPELSAKSSRWDDFIRHPDEIRFFMGGTWDEGAGAFDRVKLKVGGVEFGGSAEIRTVESHEYYKLKLSSDLIPLLKLQPWLAPLAAESGFVRLDIDVDGDSQTFRPRLDVFFKSCALRLENADLRVSNLGGSLGWANSRLTAKNLWVFVNDIPLAVDGEMAMGKEKSFKVRAVSYPGQVDPLKKINPLLFSAEANGIEMKGGWSGIVRAEIPAREASPAQTLRLSYHHLAPAGGPLWKCRAVRWHYGDSTLRDPKKDSVIGRAFFLWKADSSGVDAELADSTWCRGHLTAKGRMDLKSQTWNAEAHLKDAQMSGVLRAFHCDYPLSGTLSADVAGSGKGTEPLANLTFRISDGSVGPGEELAEWAAQTGIDALTKINFKKFSGQILYDQGVLDMKNLELDADQAYISAQLKMRENRVAGDMSLRFPASVVNPASSLKWLMDFVSADDWLDFDFKVSSNYRAARVEWTGGRFKKQIESRLAPWMRTELERQVLMKLSGRTAAAE